MPVPGVELKVAPVGDQMEGRLRGPNITPGYWANPELTREAFDEEGYYKLGDALAFFDPAGSVEGICVPGAHLGGLQALDGDVRAGWCGSDEVARALRRSGLRHRRRGTRSRVRRRSRVPERCDVPRARGHPGACSPRQLLAHPSVLGRFEEGFVSFAALHPASSTAVVRAILLEDPPAIDAQETTEKGSVNQKAVLSRRAALVAQLYGDAGPGILIDITNRTVSQ